MKSTHTVEKESSAGQEATKEFKVEAERLHLHTLVLLCCEFVTADGSHGDVGSDQGLVLEEEREGVTPAEGRADQHHRAQVQLLAHLLQEACWV